MIENLEILFNVLSAVFIIPYLAVKCGEAWEDHLEEFLILLGMIITHFPA